MLRSQAGFGHAPLHFITTRAPYQDGETVIDMRYDTRVSQIIISETMACRTEFWDRRNRLIDLLRPNRAFSSDVAEPMIYRKWLPSGKWVRGSDLEITHDSAEVVSQSAEFVSNGLEAGHHFYIESGSEGGEFTVVEVINDYTVELDNTFGADQSDIRYGYRRGRGVRDLYFLVEQGPDFGQDPVMGMAQLIPHGYREILRLVSHDPFWYGETQYEEWTAGAPTAHLVFRETSDIFTFDGGYLGETAGTGRWYFAQGFIGEETTIYYKGSAVARPIITITGPATDPVIEHAEVDLRIDIEYELESGDTLIVDTLDQTVEDGNGVNLMPWVDGDIANFGLYPDPDAPDGENNVTVTLTDAQVGTSVRIEWRNQYAGI